VRNLKLRDDRSIEGKRREENCAERKAVTIHLRHAVLRREKNLLEICHGNCGNPATLRGTNRLYPVSWELHFSHRVTARNSKSQSQFLTSNLDTKPKLFIFSQQRVREVDTFVLALLELSGCIVSIRAAQSVDLLPPIQE